MSTHFPNKIPNTLLKNWYVIDCYFTEIDDLKVHRLKEIWDAGFTHLYISMNEKYNIKMCNYIDTLLENNLNDLPKFDVVLFDSLNLADQNITKIIKSNLYIKYDCKQHNDENKMFKSVKDIFSENEMYFINTYRNFMSCNDYSLVRYYYNNQLHIKSIINALKGPFKSDYDYGIKLLEYLNEMKPKNKKNKSTSNINLNFYEMKEIINSYTKS